MTSLAAEEAASRRGGGWWEAFRLRSASLKEQRGGFAGGEVEEQREG
jgi:hypothetical protein